VQFRVECTLKNNGKHCLSVVNPAGAWQHASLEQKQRLQQMLFPQGIEYTDGVYRTQETSFLFRGLEGIAGQEEVFGSATGNRTRV